MKFRVIDNEGYVWGEFPTKAIAGMFRTSFAVKYTNLTFTVEEIKKVVA